MLLSLTQVSAGPLKSLDLELDSGEVVAVLGNNGAGKSTLLKLCAGLLTPVQGEVSIDGTPIASRSLAQRASRLAYLPQESPRPSHFACLDFVALAKERARIDAHLRSVHHDEKYRALVYDALGQFAVGHLAERDVDSLSGGEWKRVQLARVWAQEAPLLLLDEPDNGLDLHHAQLLAQKCLSYKKQGTILLATHDLHFAINVADKIIIVESGKLPWKGPATSLYEAREILSRVFRVELSWVKADEQHDRLIPVPLFAQRAGETQ